MTFGMIRNVLLGLGNFFNGCVNAFNGWRSRQVDAQKEENRKETQLKIQYLDMMASQRLEVMKQEHQNDLFDKNVDFRKDMVMEDHYFQSKLEQSRQAFMEYIEKMKMAENRSLLTFLKEVDLKISQDNLKFQKWLHMEQRQLQVELKMISRDIQMDVAAYQRETFLVEIEQKELMKNWPLRLMPSEIVNPPNKDEQVPLRIVPVVSEFEFQSQLKTSNAENPPGISKYINKMLRDFLPGNYPLNSHTSPTELLDGAWTKSSALQSSDIRSIFGKLQSEPMLFINMDIDEDDLDISVYYWGGGHDRYNFTPVISRFPYKKLLDAHAQKRAKWWEKNVKKKLLRMGRSIEDIHEAYSIDEHINLSLMKDETRLKKDGINHSFAYHHNAKDYKALYRYLAICYCALAGLFADIHFLVQNSTPPKLPSILKQLLKPLSLFPKESFSKDLEKWIIDNYLEAFNSLRQYRSHEIPTLALDMARTLAEFKNFPFAEKLLNYSLQQWLKNRGIHDLDAIKDEELIKNVLIEGDEHYLRTLYECSRNLDFTSITNYTLAIWRTWCTLMIGGDIENNELGGPIAI